MTSNYKEKKYNKMEFGLPKVKSLKTEKYENDGVLTFLPTGPGLGRKMSFNKKAAEIMGLEGENLQVSFSFSTGAIHIVNTFGTNITGLTVSKTGKSVSDKKHYEYIKYSLYNSTEKDELELFLTETENTFEGRKVFLLQNISDYKAKDVEEAIEEEYVAKCDQESSENKEYYNPEITDQVSLMEEDGVAQAYYKELEASEEQEIRDNSLDQDEVFSELGMNN